MIPAEELNTLMAHIPGMVLINRILPDYADRCVALDDRYGAWLATRHLIQMGHRRIAFICSSHSIPDSVDRLQGYRDALEEFHIALDEKLIAFGEPDEVGGRTFTAIACYNDSTAAGAMAVLSDNGIEVPQDISLVGFDDVLISRYLRPRLTNYPLSCCGHGHPGGAAGAG